MLPAWPLCAACRGPHKDSIEVKRVGSQPSKVTITFEQDFAMPVYKVDPRLAEVGGRDEKGWAKRGRGSRGVVVLPKPEHAVLCWR